MSYLLFFNLKTSEAFFNQSRQLIRKTRTAKNLQLLYGAPRLHLVKMKIHPAPSVLPLDGSVGIL